MSGHVDLEPAARRMARLVQAVPDDALDRPTPCEHYSVGDLLDHVDGAAVAFAAAAVKRPLEAAPSGDRSRLDPDWRTLVPRHVLALPGAWRDPASWEGMTRVGGVDLPGDLAGIVALDELVIHGWDLAVATGQAPAYDGPGLQAVYDTVQQFRSGGIEGLFGSEVAVADDVRLFDRILALAGRDPRWAPPG